MLYTMRNIVGGGDCWAQTTNGTIQVKTLSANDTSIIFTNVPANEFYGYKLFLDTASAATANTDPPKQVGQLAMTLETNGTYTVTATITSVTAAQVGTKAQLRIIK